MSGTTLETLQNQLDKVNSAINGTLDRNAADLDIAGRSLSSFSLDALIRLRGDIERRIAKLSGDQKPVFGTFGGD